MGVATPLWASLSESKGPSFSCPPGPKAPERSPLGFSVLRVSWQSQGSAPPIQHNVGVGATSLYLALRGPKVGVPLCGLAPILRSLPRRGPYLSESFVNILPRRGPKGRAHTAPLGAGKGTKYIETPLGIYSGTPLNGNICPPSGPLWAPPG